MTDKLVYEENKSDLLKIVQFSKFKKSISTQKTHFYSLWDFTKFLAEKKGYSLSENKNEEMAKLMAEFTNNSAFGAKLLVSEYLIELQNKNQSTSTLATKLAAIKDHIAYQKGMSGFPDWDLDFLQAPKVENRKVHGLTKEEFNRLLLYISKLENSQLYIDKRNALMCLILSMTALRVSEMLSIDIEEINIYAQKFLVSRKTKKKKQEFFIGKNLLEKINSFLKDDGRVEGPLFINQDKLKKTGKRLTRQSVYRIIKEIGLRVGIENLHPHRFRHFAATEAEELVGKEKAMKFTSHVSDKIFSRYVDERQKDQLLVSEMLEERWIKLNNKTE